MGEKTAQTQQLPTMTVQPRSKLAPEDWEIVEDVPAPDGPFEIRLDKLLRDDESRLDGEAGLKRAREMGDLVGESHTELILEQRDAIPTEYRAFGLIIAGTVRRDPSGYRCFLYLYWDGDRWHSYWSWLGYDFDSYSRVVRLCK